MDDKEYAAYAKVDENTMDAYLDFALSSADEEMAEAIEAVYLA